MLAIAVGLCGLLLLVLTAQDAFEVMLLPRRVLRRLRFVSLYYRLIWAGWSEVTSRTTNRVLRENLLAVFGALSMVLLFGIWTAGLIAGYGLLLWAAETMAAVSPVPDVLDQLYMSGVTFFTLGYGDFIPHSAGARFLTVLEAGTGLGFIAVVIGYLPVLYQLFSRREAAVIRLDGRAGSPPTATGLLQRHGGEDGVPQIVGLLKDWENWGSELLESHLSYPMLAYYRSQHDDQSWLAALAIIIDCCAVILVGLERVPPLQARMTFMMARQILVEMAQSFRLEPTISGTGERLGHKEFLKLQQQLGNSGFDLAPDAEPLLRSLRATYEPLLQELARYLLLPMPGWTPDDTHPDHWERGLRGSLARHLVDELAPPREGVQTGAERRGRWRRRSARPPEG